MANSWLARASKTPKSMKFVQPTSEYRSFPDFPLPKGVEIIKAGEAAALSRFKEFTKRASILTMRTEILQA